MPNSETTELLESVLYCLLDIRDIELSYRYLPTAVISVTLAWLRSDLELPRAVRKTFLTV